MSKNNHSSQRCPNGEKVQAFSLDLEQEEPAATLWYVVGSGALPAGLALGWNNLILNACVEMLVTNL